MTHRSTGVSQPGKTHVGSAAATKAARRTGGSCRGVDTGRATPTTVRCSSSVTTHRHVVVAWLSRAASAAIWRARAAVIGPYPASWPGSDARPSQVVKGIVSEIWRPTLGPALVQPEHEHAPPL